MLPDADGFELLRQLREVPSLEAVPIVALSELAWPIEDARAGRPGFTALLRKPVEPGTLVNAVAGLLPRCLSRRWRAAGRGAVAPRRRGRRPGPRDRCQVALRDVLAATLEAAAISGGAVPARRRRQPARAPRHRVLRRGARRAGDVFGHRERFDELMSRKATVSIREPQVPAEVAHELLDRADVATAALIPLVFERRRGGRHPARGPRHRRDQRGPSPSPAPWATRSCVAGAAGSFARRALGGALSHADRDRERRIAILERTEPSARSTAGMRRCSDTGARRYRQAHATSPLRATERDNMDTHNDSLDAATAPVVPGAAPTDGWCGSFSARPWRSAARGWCSHRPRRHRAGQAQTQLMVVRPHGVGRHAGGRRRARDQQPAGLGDRQPRSRASRRSPSCRARAPRERRSSREELARRARRPPSACARIVRDLKMFSRATRRTHGPGRRAARARVDAAHGAATRSATARGW